MAILLGPRKGKYVDGQVKAMPASNLPLAAVGVFLLWFGWFGFNAGSALTAGGLAATAFLTTNTASAAAMLSWVFLDGAAGRRPSALGACMGAVVGLVAITPAAGFVSVGSAVLIGVVAASVSNLAVHWSSRSALDDTLDVFPCHGVGGVVGMLLTGALATKTVNPDGADGLVFGGVELFGVHLAAMVGVALFTFVGSWILFKVVDKILPLRVTDEQEDAGLDLSQHDETILLPDGAPLPHLAF